MKNPFRLSARATPPDIIGRAGVLDDFAHSLGMAAGAPGLLAIITGARGVGKTAMLGVARDLAWGRG